MSDLLRISDSLAVPIADIQLTAVRAQGAGGQNVNKVATAIHLRFDVAACDSLPDAAKDRILAHDDRRVTADGVIVIKAQEFRTQDRNRQAALQRLRELLTTALIEKEPRRKTRIPAAVKEKRLDSKRRRSQLKRSRRGSGDDS